MIFATVLLLDLAIVLQDDGALPDQLVCWRFVERRVKPLPGLFSTVGAQDFVEH